MQYSLLVLFAYWIVLYVCGCFFFNPYQEGVTLRAVTNVGTNFLFAVGDSGTIARSSDRGSTWTVWRNMNQITTPLHSIDFTTPNRDLLSVLMVYYL